MLFKAGNGSVSQGLLVFSMTLLFGLSGIHAQQLSNFRKKVIDVSADMVSVDTLSLVPNSLSIKGVDPTNYRVDPVRSILYWIIKPNIPQVEIIYRVFPLQLGGDTKHMSYDSILNRFMITPEKISGKSASLSPIDFGKLKSNGSLGRSLSFGNRQDAVLNSSLNLQLSGLIGDSIFLTAAISDNNIPIQPDGNTQNLNEFDQVFIQFSKDNWKFTMGDLDVRQSELYFLNFYKRLQGGLFEDEQRLKSGMKNKIMASAAIAKGKFTRNIFQGIEGNQGPYRLKGANQEMFFIVLAGTERVFIDGVMLQRGEDQDYVINYNTAEVTFTPRQLITKDKRIQIEFEYADRNFLNTQLFLHDRLVASEKLTLSVGYFGNADAKNSPVNQTLSSAQKQFLSVIGDDFQNAYYTSAIADTSSINRIRYIKKDTLYAQGRRTSIYVYENLASTDLYSLSFTDFGEQGGNYILDKSLAANGKVYKWVAPDPVTGKKNGRFEPVVLLVTPKKQNIFTMASTWKVNNSTELITDLAISNNDVNTFSSKQKANDDGYAGKVSLIKSAILQKERGLLLKTNINAEFSTHAFKPVERLRSVEFTRDWGLDILTESADEKLMGITVSLQDKSSHRMGYTFGSYWRAQDFRADRHNLEHAFDQRGWRFDNRITYTSMEDPSRKGYFFRPGLDFSKRFPGWKNREIGFRYALERNLNSFIGWDSISANSFSFSTTQVYVNSDPTKPNKWGISYFTRTDELPFNNKLIKTDKSHNYNFNTELMSSSHHQLRFNANYRMLDVFKSTNGLNKDNSLLGRAEYVADVWRGGVTGNVLYELGTGQEPRKEFIYFEVPAGQGEYTWIDFNSDGVQQINEFEVAKFRDQAKYLRIFTPLNEFIKTNYLQANYNFIFNPSVALSKKDKNLSSDILRRIYVQSSLQLGKKQFASVGRDLNPFSTDIADTSLITFDQIQSNTFSYNKFSQRWGLDINYLVSSNRSFLSYGYETRRLKDVSFRLRMNWFRVFTLEWVLKKNKNILETPRFGNRNFNIDAFSVEPRLTYTKGTTLRLGSGYKIDDKQNQGLERAVIHSFNLEGKFTKLSKTSIGTKLAFSSIKFNGASNSTLGYVMMDGLLPGKNMIWTIDFTKRLSTFLEMTLQYEGRKSGSTNMVNIGRAQIRAIL